jgi:RNA polymerase sigma-70 factor, ECF subfamily
VTLEEAVRAYAADLLRAAIGFGVSPLQAEELVAATFAAYLEAQARFEGRSTLKTFLFGILYRKALEAGRKAQKELAVDPADAAFEGRFDGWGHWSRLPTGPESLAEQAETARLISDCLANLPEIQRAAFLMKEADGLSSEEACYALGVERTHMRVLLFRARAKLRDCLEAKWK